MLYGMTISGANSTPASRIVTRTANSAAALAATTRVSRRLVYIHICR